MWRLLVQRLFGTAPLHDALRMETWISEEQWLAGFPAPWRDYSGWCNLRRP